MSGRHIRPIRTTAYRWTMAHFPETAITLSRSAEPGMNAEETTNYLGSRNSDLGRLVYGQYPEREDGCRQPNRQPRPPSEIYADAAQQPPLGPRQTSYRATE